MRTIDEIKEDLMYVPNAYASHEAVEEFILNLNELIETVAALQREKCAKEAKLLIEYGEQSWEEDEIWSINAGNVTVSKESILNAKL